MTATTIAGLRREALARVGWSTASLPSAIERLGFVQMDPLQAPARAQELILRSRVAGLTAGTLDRAYASLDVEEDVLHAYGILPRSTWRLLHPRLDPAGAPHIPVGLDAEVLALVKERAGDGPLHPRTAAAELGPAVERNAWGGQSRATTRALERLHYWGLLRVAGRVRGVRCYAPALHPSAPATLDPVARFDRLALHVAALLAPVTDATLRDVLALVRRHAAPQLRAEPEAAPRVAIRRLEATGRLRAEVVAGLRYLTPAADAADRAAPGGTPRDAGLADERPGAGDRVRIVAPFDPLVWDRRRFEHLWGWPYRFEAYTPAPRRRFGYYALPLLWRAEAVGWVTAHAGGGVLDVDARFVRARPRDRAFTRAYDAEVDALRRFLGLQHGA